MTRFREPCLIAGIGVLSLLTAVASEAAAQSSESASQASSVGVVVSSRQGAFSKGVGALLRFSATAHLQQGLEERACELPIDSLRANVRRKGQDLALPQADLDAVDTFAERVWGRCAGACTQLMSETADLPTAWESRRRWLTGALQLSKFENEVRRASSRVEVMTIMRKAGRIELEAERQPQPLEFDMRAFLGSNPAGTKGALCGRAADEHLKWLSTKSKLHYKEIRDLPGHISRLLKERADDVHLDDYCHDLYDTYQLYRYWTWADGKVVPSHVGHHQAGITIGFVNFSLLRAIQIEPGKPLRWRWEYLDELASYREPR